MNKEKFTIKSEYDGLDLSCLIYVPTGEKKGVLQISHGMCEYKERYTDFMNYFASQGYVVCAHDHRGHGDSVKIKEEYGFFGDKKGNAIVDDLFLVTKELKKRYPDLPIYLYGHSMGSLVVRVYLQKHDMEIKKLIVSGSPSKNAMAGIGIALDKTIALFKGGEKYRSPMMAGMTTGDGDDHFPSEGKNAWLTRDKEIVKKYNADEKCNYTFTCNGFENLLRLMKNTYTANRYKVENPELPIFFVAGSNDPIIVNEEKWQKAQQFLRDIGYKNVSGKLYHEMRHEVHNEIGKEEVYKDILNFIEK